MDDGLTGGFLQHRGLSDLYTVRWLPKPINYHAVSYTAIESHLCAIQNMWLNFIPTARDLASYKENVKDSYKENVKDCT